MEKDIIENEMETVAPATKEEKPVIEEVVIEESEGGAADDTDERYTALEQRLEALSNSLDELKERERKAGEIAKISALVPEITNEESLAAFDTEGKVAALVERGYGIYDAFAAAYAPFIAQRAAKSERQRVINEFAAKDHLHPTAASPLGHEVPADVRSAYLALDPDVSPGEIRKHYNKYLRRAN